MLDLQEGRPQFPGVPQRPASSAVRSVEEEPTRLTISLVHDGYTPAKIRARPRPTARGATLGDFVSKNSFQALGGEGAPQRPPTSTTAATVARRRPTTTTTETIAARPIQTISRDDDFGEPLGEPYRASCGCMGVCDETC